MKRIDELTEQEILALTSEDIALMIKLAKAEAGIKFITYPVEPEYDKVSDPTITTYSSDLLGDRISFTNVDELNALIKTIKSFKTLVSVDYNWNYGSENRYISKPTNITELNTTTRVVYSNEQYNNLKELIINNKKLKEDYEVALKEYKTNEEYSVDIVNTIKDKVGEVTNKYQRFEELYNLFVNTYLPLANDDYSIAKKFLNNAYHLSIEQEDYIANKYEAIN